MNYINLCFYNPGNWLLILHLDVQGNVRSLGMINCALIRNRRNRLHPSLQLISVCCYGASSVIQFVFFHGYLEGDGEGGEEHQHDQRGHLLEKPLSSSSLIGIANPCHHFHWGFFEGDEEAVNMTKEAICLGTYRRTFCIFCILLIVFVIIITAIALGLTLGHRDSERWHWDNEILNRGYF